MAAKQVAAIKAKACFLNVLHESAGLIKLKCLVGTPTPIATNTPTPAPSSTPTQTPIPAFQVGGVVSGLSGTVVLQNNGADNLSLTSNGAFHFSTLLQEGASYNVTVLAQPATQTCTVTNGSGIMSASSVSNVSVSCAANSTTLSVSTAALALSVTGITEYGVSGTPSSGLARTITVTNTGSYDGLNLAVSLPTFPAGTTASSSCGATLVASGSCTITVTPGGTATSDGTNPCTTGTAPVPGAVSITSDNATTVTTNVAILGYGCIYQGGYVYAFDDTTASTSSVGGKVLTTTDQASTFPNGSVWSSNGGTGGAGGGFDTVDVSYDTIPGINETSTAITGSPTYAAFASFFSSTYTNPNPFSAGSFSACDGARDGSCNSINIQTFYNQFITNNTTGSGGTAPFTASAGPTNITYYAMGLCAQTISTYSDWYLPAICELGFDASSSGTGCGTGVSPAVQNAQSSLVDGGSVALAGNYWSSSQFSSLPLNGWAQFFAGLGGSFQTSTNKSFQLGVRCSRRLT